MNANTYLGPNYLVAVVVAVILAIVYCNILVSKKGSDDNTLIRVDPAKLGTQDSEDELEEDDEEEQDAQTNVKLLNLTLANDNVENNLQFEELNAQEIIIDDSLSLNTDGIKKIHIDNNNNEENNDGFVETEHSTLIETKENEQIINEDLHFLKNVSITDLGDMQDLLTNKSEYKKLSLNKLREVVISKGIVSDASKLKKNDILKLLGDE